MRSSILLVIWINIINTSWSIVFDFLWCASFSFSFDGYIGIDCIDHLLGHYDWLLREYGNSLIRVSRHNRHNIQFHLCYARGVLDQILWPSTVYNTCQPNFCVPSMKWDHTLGWRMSHVWRKVIFLRIQVGCSICTFPVDIFFFIISSWIDALKKFFFRITDIIY